MFCDLKHGKVMKRVAKHGIGMGQADTAECGGFRWAGGNIDEFARDYFVYDFDLGGQNTFFGDTEFADAFGDNPLVGGTYCPEFYIGVAKGSDKRSDFGEDSRTDKLVEVAGGGGAEFLFVKTGVHLHHFAADFEFADGTGDVSAVARVHPIGSGAGDEALVDGPDHEAIPGVPTPEGTVAVEDRDTRGGFGEQILELFGGPAGNFELRGRQANSILC